MSSAAPSTGRFVAPPYPYDRLAELTALAGRHPGGAVDLSIGTPGDPPADDVVAALGTSGTERGYPASVGSASVRRAAAGWVERRFGVVVAPESVATCVGTKELVATVPWLLRLGRPERDVVLYPAVSYPTYAMGAQLAGCRAVGVQTLPDGRLDLAGVAPDVVRRTLMAWVNSPANPTGGLCDLDAAAEWGRAEGVPVFSDECYAEFTWDGPPRTILSSGTDGVVAVHSLSKRSNLAGARMGFYTGDPSLVRELAELRRHVGMMVPGPVQAASAVAWGDDAHVEVQRARYRRRLHVLAAALGAAGVATSLPGGGFYLWVPVPVPWTGADAWDLARALASAAGVVVSPGDLYGEPVAAHVRIAVVAPDDKVAEVAARIRAGGPEALDAARRSTPER